MEKVRQIVAENIYMLYVHSVFTVQSESSTKTLSFIKFRIYKKKQMYVISVMHKDIDILNELVVLAGRALLFPCSLKK